jgi:hypothetical protein
VCVGDGDFVWLLTIRDLEAARVCVRARVAVTGRDCATVGVGAGENVAVGLTLGPGGTPSVHPNTVIRARGSTPGGNQTELTLSRSKQIGSQNDTFAPGTVDRM